MRRIPTQHLSTPLLTALGGTNSVEPTSHPNHTLIDWLPDLPLHWLPVAKGPAAVGEALRIRRIIQEMMFAVLNALPELSRVQPDKAVVGPALCRRTSPLPSKMASKTALAKNLQNGAKIGSK